MGQQALYFNTVGAYNTAVGDSALEFVTSGQANIGLGNSAGDNLTTGNNNIDIGNEGVSTDAGVTRIGTQGKQITTFISGIYGTFNSDSAATVYVDNTNRQAAEITRLTEQTSKLAKQQEELAAALAQLKAPAAPVAATVAQADGARR